MKDTIAAIATPPGSGGVGIVRMSGVKAKQRLTEMFCPASSKFSDFKPWTLHRGHLLNKNGEILDDILAVYMPAPNTYTGENVVELQCHGGHILLLTILESVLCSGVRLAERGEFSQRAFLNGRMDLTQAEAIAELISASSLSEVKFASHRLNGLLGHKVLELQEQLEQVRALVYLAIDFPDEESAFVTSEMVISGLKNIYSMIQQLVQGVERSRCWREGVVVTLAGAVNVGKSSLLNALLGTERAIVTEFPGTTRDFLEECVHLLELPVRLIDTAGIRETSEPIEVQGIHIGQEKIRSADVILLIVDGTIGITEQVQLLLQELDANRIILVWNKVDLQEPLFDWIESCVVTPARTVCVSAKTGQGIDTLTATIRELALYLHDGEEPLTDGIVPNMRQSELFSEALQELDALFDDIYTKIPYDLCAVRLESIATILSSILGCTTPDDVLNRIFASFCIGK